MKIFPWDCTHFLHCCPGTTNLKIQRPGDWWQYFSQIEVFLHSRIDDQFGITRTGSVDGKFTLNNGPTLVKLTDPMHLHKLGLNSLPAIRKVHLSFRICGRTRQRNIRCVCNVSSILGTINVYTLVLVLFVVKVVPTWNSYLVIVKACSTDATWKNRWRNPFQHFNPPHKTAVRHNGGTGSGF